ncbi:MAG: hypothetical protein Kow0031_07580 [Anaerolineae bacterium]
MLTALVAGVILLNPANGIFKFLLWGPKLYASALAPLLAAAGAGLAMAGALRKNWPAAGLAMLGAMVSAGHVWRVTRPQGHQFEAVFGPGWAGRVPAGQRRQWRRFRWLPFSRRRRVGPLHLDVTFGANSESGRPLTADLMLPPPGAPHSGAAMIFVHGGGWWFGRKNIGKFPYFRRLVAQGHVVMDINYTLAPHSSVVGMVQDVVQAVAWLKRRAARFGINPGKIVLTGQSAGAQLCLLVAFAPNLPAFQPPGPATDARVCGVIAYNGPPDMTALYYDVQARFMRHIPARLVDAAQRLLENLVGYGNRLGSGIGSVVGATPATDPDRYRLLSPLTYAGPGCPPAMLLQATHDTLVDVTQVERFYRRLRRAGAPVIYVPFPNCDHAFESILPRLSPPAQTAAYHTERFVAALAAQPDMEQLNG